LAFIPSVCRRTDSGKDIKIDNELKYETELVNIRKHYRDEFLKILSPDQLSMLYKSEREFNDEMVKQLGERAVNPVN
jgi:hypothetical protein